MKKKRIVAIIMTLVLLSSMGGCGRNDKKESKESLTKTETSQKKEDKKDIIEPTKENLLALGKKQTQDIKKIAEKYGITTEGRKVEALRAQLQISKDENDLCEISSSYRGYSVLSGNKIKINDGRQNEYKISYTSTYDEKSGTPTYVYDIYVKYSLEDFKIEKAQMLKELILALHDGNYDFNGFDEWINKCMKGTREKTLNTDKIHVEQYEEEISDAFLGDKGVQMLIIGFRLRK